MASADVIGIAASFSHNAGGNNALHSLKPCSTMAAPSGLHSGFSLRGSISCRATFFFSLAGSKAATQPLSRNMMRRCERLCSCLTVAMAASSRSSANPEAPVGSAMGRPRGASTSPKYAAAFSTERSRQPSADMNIFIAFPRTHQRITFQPSNWGGTSRHTPSFAGGRQTPSSGRGTRASAKWEISASASAPSSLTRASPPSYSATLAAASSSRCSTRRQAATADWVLSPLGPW
mmetsp:Transcript_24091/g.73753  ORF Transcript_24091/g.73753 Transcript_24091/m.73753 type:complete len:234 (+) Transcript_24091:1024-1725(+)